MVKDVTDTRQLILHAALKRFADAGYAATSVQHIVDDAKVSKPALYYHFADKAGLFQALVHEAHDQRYRILREAAEASTGIHEQLENILAALFDYFRENRELMRISFATMLPRRARCQKTFPARRNASAISSSSTRSSSGRSKRRAGQKFQEPRAGVRLLWPRQLSSRVAPRHAGLRAGPVDGEEQLWNCFWPAPRRNQTAGKNNFKQGKT